MTEAFASVISFFSVSLSSMIRRSYLIVEDEI